MYAVQWVLRHVACIFLFWPSQMIWLGMGISTWWNTSLKHLKRFKEFQSEVDNHRKQENKSFYDMIAEVKYLSYEFGLQLKQCEIVSLLTPPGTPQHNGVSERHNRTLLNIVQSMMSLTNLSLSCWDYALEIAAFTLNRAPSKSVETTPYELWFG